MRWRIHTGPFPFIVPGHAGELWLWRITNGQHFTSVTVNIARAVRDADRSKLAAGVRLAVETRGRSAVEVCLSWLEPPREITFDNEDRPLYWGGRLSNVD